MAKRKPSRTEKPARQYTASPAKALLPAVGTEDLLQWSKSGFDSAVKLSNAIFEGFEHMREMQMHAAHDAREKNDKLARELMQIRSPADLAQLEMELARANIERATSYWQQMFTISNQINAKLVEEVKNECLSASEKMNRTLGGAGKSVEKPAAAAATEPLKAAMDMTNMNLTNWTKAASQWMDTAKQNWQNMSATHH
jgi:Phasin protein